MKTSGSKQWPLVFLFTAWLVTGPWQSAAQDLNLPDIGDPASTVLSPAQEYALGKTLIREVRRSLKLIEDPELNNYIQSLGLHLVSSSPEGNPHFIFVIIDDPLINAFALPGGIVAVNSGLIAAAESEAELASVMAHEIAHVTQRHLARMYADSDKLSFATGLAILAAIVASAYDSELGEAALYSTMAASAQRQLNFSRANEQEADRVGISTLAGAGYNPHAMPSFFEKLYRLSFTSPDAIPEYLRTHPVTTSRISDSSSRADQYQGNYQTDSQDFQLARARLNALQQDPRETIAHFEKSRSPTRRSLSDEYGYALALTRAGSTKKALEILARLNKTHKNLLPLQLAYASALMKDRQTALAVKQLSQLNEIYPRHEPVVHLYAQALLQAQRPADAVRLLEETARTGTANPGLYKLMAEAAANAGRGALSHEALADYYFSYGQYPAALNQLELALANPGIDAVTEARVRTKRDSLQKALKDAPN